MQPKQHPSSPEPSKAEAAFAEFLDRCESGESLDFDAFCSERPEIAQGLRSLRSLRDPTAVLGKDGSPPGAAGRILLDAATALAPPPESQGAAEPRLRQLGDYRIVRELGRGGMGVVYEAEQLSLGRHVALKVPPTQALLDPSFLERFRCEARAAARLHHPNIVPVFGVGEHDGVHYYAMQFIEGRSLDSVIENLKLLRGKVSGAERDGPAGRPGSPGKGPDPESPLSSIATVLLSLYREPPPTGEEETRRAGGTSPGGAPGSGRSPWRAGGDAEAKGTSGAPGSPRKAGSGNLATLSLEDRSYFRNVARLGRQAADALSYAHGEGILHRDIKPSNLILDGRGTVWVTDFGLAKASGSENLTKSGDVVGTLAYMAPERFSGWSSPQGDIYALGLTLYELLTLQPAFRDTDAGRLIRRVKEEEPQRPSKLRRRVPRDLETIVLKAMAKEPARRYPSAGEMAEDLDRFLTDQAIRARPASSVYRLKVFVKRNRVAFSTAAAVVLLAAVAVFFAGQVFSARRFEENLAAGRWRMGQFQVLKGRIAALEARWRSLRAERNSWDPVWEREDELEAWQDFQGAQRGIDNSYQKAVLAFNRALEDAPLDSARRRGALRALEDVFWERYQDAKGLGAVSIRPDEYKVMIQSLGLGTYSEELKWGSVAFESDPPGADILCLRYEEYEAHLVPIPFDPQRGIKDSGAGLLAEPLLAIEAVWNPALCRSLFRAGDRFLKIGHRDLHLEGDLASALSGVKAGEEVQVEILRAGREETVRWTPFPESLAEGPEGTLRPGRMVSAREQFGFTFAGYPFQEVPGCRVGTTKAGSPLELKLPEGSYLFVFRKEGYREARFPVAVPMKGRLQETLRLLRESEIPEGFVWIPAGPFSSGGDPEAFQSLPRGERRLEGFFLSRHETTFREYLEFLNDRRIPESGEDSPVSREVMEEISKVRSAKGKVRLVPVNERDGKSLVTRTPEGRWVLPASRVLTGDSPVFGVPHLAAQEYADWCTRTKGRGFKFRLPSDLEWEKAARGADRRTFVWGSYPIWSFSWSNKGIFRESKSPPGSVGISPIDESVFGVRDMAGSVSEHTDGRTQPEQGYRYSSIRGGNFYNTDDFWFRIATRNGILPENSGVNTGFRLAAEPAKTP